MVKIMTDYPGYNCLEDAVRFYVDCDKIGTKIVCAVEKLEAMEREGEPYCIEDLKDILYSIYPTMKEIVEVCECEF